MTQGKEMNDLMRHCDKLKATNAELLAALEGLLVSSEFLRGQNEVYKQSARDARAAIAKAGGAA